MPKQDEANRTRSETITPLSISLPKKTPDPVHPRARYRFGITILVGILALMIGSGLWLLRYLSKNPLGPSQATPKAAPIKPDPLPKTIPSQSAEQTAPAVDPRQLALEKQLAEDRLADFLEAKADLDGKGAGDWGPQDYAEIGEAARRADALLVESDYKRAADEYGRAVNLARQLSGRSGAVLQELLVDGRAALAEGDGAAARRKFSAALKIDPDNPTAAKGLKRSQTIAEVHRLLKSGTQHEEKKALAMARDDYRKALQIDPESDSARRSLERVTARLKDQQFHQLLSAGLTAYHNNDLTLARNQLLKAKTIKPSSPEVAEALFQVNQATRTTRINQLRTTAEAAERSENWQTALSSYRKVLEIDPKLQFAVSGKERSGEQLRTAKRLDYYLAQPKVLESDEQLKKAILLIEEAKEIEPRGRKLSDQINALKNHISAAQTPVVVIIESDNLTQVAVYRVGKLGRFTQRELKLRPGTYTVVGARNGYQDVRQKIVVKPDQQALRVTVKCRAKI